MFVHEASMVLSEQSHSIADISYRPSDLDLIIDDAKFDLKIEKMTPTLNNMNDVSKFSSSSVQQQTCVGAAARFRILLLCVCVCVCTNVSGQMLLLCPN